MSEIPRQPDNLPASPAGSQAGQIAPSLALRGLLRWVYAHNPFYVISASLFFWGLRVSFDTSQPALFEDAAQSMALTIGLAAYTLVLALTTLLVIRFGKVWEDGRTQLLLIVILLLAISVSIDHVFGKSLTRGVLCAVTGLAFAVALSEGLLRGLKIRLPLGFRLPYHMILAVLFLYPILLGMRFQDIFDPSVPWLLLGFPAAVGIASLSLLPAIRRGPEYVRDNGTPWHWPWYPWCLFGFLGLGVCGRSFYLCKSLHLAGGDASVFAPYFLVPLGAAVNILVLEMGLVGKSQKFQRAALLMPLAWLVLPLLGCSPAKVPSNFLTTVMDTFGATPLFVTAWLVAAFYFLAMLRGVPRAVEALTVALLTLAFIGRQTQGLASLVGPEPLPVLLIGVLQTWFALLRPNSARTLAAAGALVAGLMLWTQPGWFDGAPLTISAHFVIAAMLLIGAVFDDAFARFLRAAGAGALFVAGAAAVSLGSTWYPEISRLMLALYPFAAILAALAYGYFLHSRLFFLAAAATTLAWGAAAGAMVYQAMREAMAGLDYLAWALVSLIVAIGISMFKAGPLRAWIQQWKQKRWPKQIPESPPLKIE